MNTPDQALRFTDPAEWEAQWAATVGVQRYSCPKHGMHADWLQFRWSARAGQSNLYCLRCFADHLETALPVGGVVVPP